MRAIATGLKNVARPPVMTPITYEFWSAVAEEAHISRLNPRTMKRVLLIEARPGSI